MATSTKILNEKLREHYVGIIAEALAKMGEEVMMTNSNELAIPCLDSEGNDKFCTFTIKIPTGSRDGEPYDAYALAQEYRSKQLEKQAKAAERAEAKAKKIARDTAHRAKLAKSKEDYHK